MKAPSRRQFLKIAALLPFGAVRAAAEGPKPHPADHGIGGTGASLRRAGGEEDHGIGGTGIVGTIQRFGSIYVNGLRVRYGRDVAVFIDGKRTAAGAMRIGHVARAILEGAADRPVTRRIDITSEVIGRVEQVGKGKMTVLSQAIELASVKEMPRLRPGMVVAVFGIRAPDGRIVASRVERRPESSAFMVRGVAISSGGNLKIGGLTIARPAGRLAGHRVEVGLRQAARGLQATRVSAEALVPGLSSGTVNVETFRRRDGEDVRVDGGRGEGPSRGRDPAEHERAFVDFHVGPDGAAGRMHGGPDPQGRPPADWSRGRPDGRPPEHGPMHDGAGFPDHAGPPGGRAPGGPPGGEPPGGSPPPR